MGNWSNFIEEIRNSIRSLGLEKNEECFYRGHINSTWLLMPGLFRNVNQVSTSRSRKGSVIPEDLWEIENDLYFEFKSRARELLKAELSDWDILFYMQHHGVKTRLLDWSESFGVALYFALHDKGSQSLLQEPCIWMLNPYALNEHFGHQRDLWEPESLNYYGNAENNSYSELLLDSYQEEKGSMFHWNYPVALYPARRSDRLANQSAYFTIHGNYIAPIEALCKGQSFLKKILIPHDLIPECLEHLALFGINEFGIYPDLDGLSRYLNEKNF